MKANKDCYIQRNGIHGQLLPCDGKRYFNKKCKSCSYGTQAKYTRRALSKLLDLYNIKVIAARREDSIYYTRPHPLASFPYFDIGDNYLVDVYKAIDKLCHSKTSYTDSSFVIYNSIPTFSKFKSIMISRFKINDAKEYDQSYISIDSLKKRINDRNSRYKFENLDINTNLSIDAFEDQFTSEFFEGMRFWILCDDVLAYSKSSGLNHEIRLVPLDIPEVTISGYKNSRLRDSIYNGIKALQLKLMIDEYECKVTVSVPITAEFIIKCIKDSDMVKSVELVKEKTGMGYETTHCKFLLYRNREVEFWQKKGK